MLLYINVIGEIGCLNVIGAHFLGLHAPGLVDQGGVLALFLGGSLSQLLGRFFGELGTLFIPRAETRIRREWKTVELAAGIQVVPDLNKYLAPKSALVVQFDCATQKSRHIVRLAQEHLRFHPSLRIIFVSCRIVHAHDLMADLDEGFRQ